MKLLCFMLTIAFVGIGIIFLISCFIQVMAWFYDLISFYLFEEITYRNNRLSFFVNKNKKKSLGEKNEYRE